ncbi:MAG: BatA domain-containing protein, partial [Planctomycetota bacterium]
MQFVFQPLAWGFLLVLLPLLIHLINLVRHRRTEWAAMDFLLESYRKNRRWVWLKQALLIASRMLAMAILVAMLAQWITGSKWLAAFGRTTTHHFIILDDSASMADSANGKSAYQTALGALSTIASAANQGSQQHLMSIFRASRASLAANRARESENSETNVATEAPADAIADLLARTIPADASGLLSKINSTSPTQLECSLNETLAAIGPLLQSDQSDRAIVYIMSDFRTKDWSNATILRQHLQSLSRGPVEIQLIDCVESRHENLTLSAIEPRQEVLAAGVPT